MNPEGSLVVCLLSRIIANRLTSGAQHRLFFDSACFFKIIFAFFPPWSSVLIQLLCMHARHWGHRELRKQLLEVSSYLAPCWFCGWVAHSRQLAPELLGECLARVSHLSIWDTCHHSQTFMGVLESDPGWQACMDSTFPYRVFPQPLALRNYSQCCQTSLFWHRFCYFCIPDTSCFYTLSTLDLFLHFYSFTSPIQ